MWVLWLLALVTAEEWVGAEDSDQDFSYPEKQSHGWKGVCRDGESQSPLNLPDRSELKERDGGIEITWSPNLNIKGENDGKTIVWKPYDLKEKNKRRRNMGHVVLWDSTVDSRKKFYHRKFLVHTKSEHTIESKQADLEIQFVHSREDGKGSDMKTTWGIVSMLCNVESEKAEKKDNELGEFFELARKAAKSDDPIPIKLESVLGNKLKTYSYYNYTGSLTTPPCTENVNWIVLGEECVLPKSFADFLKNSDNSDAMSDNFRQAQKLNERKIWTSESEPADANEQDAEEEKEDDGKEENSKEKEKTKDKKNNDGQKKSNKSKDDGEKKSSKDDGEKKSSKDDGEKKSNKGDGENKDSSSKDDGKSKKLKAPKKKVKKAVQGKSKKATKLEKKTKTEKESSKQAPDRGAQSESVESSKNAEDGEEVGRTDDIEIVDYDDIQDFDHKRKRGEDKAQTLPDKPATVIADSEGIDGEAVSEVLEANDDALYAEEDFSGIDDFLDVEVQQSLPDVMKKYVNYALVASIMVCVVIFMWSRPPRKVKQPYESYQLIDDEI